MSKRGDRVPRPPVGDDWDVKFANSGAANVWDELCIVAATNCAGLVDLLRRDPRSMASPGRHHRLKGELRDVTVRGKKFEQWQHEVTSAGRVWFGIEDANRTVWVTFAKVGHPSKTDR